MKITFFGELVNGGWDWVFGGGGCRSVGGGRGVQGMIIYRFATISTATPFPINVFR